ncbi:Putative multidrug resistance protein MdtD [uncultured archaeon]|nr:Putative multidrug resistance protein MdtD [uncultured archaeon]
MASSKKTISKDNLKWWVLATVIIGTFLGRLDQTIVNLALPKIIIDFRITVAAAGWIATAYILANAVFVPVWGKLGDTIGRKKVYLLGFSIFIFGSILAGFAWNLSSMIVFRIIQAVAASADYPTAMAIIAVTFKAGKERAQALGIWSASFAAAVVFGPLIGGPLIDLFGWRSVFLINLPIGVIGIIMAMVFIDESVSEKKTKSFDLFGAITLGIVLSSLVLVLDQGMSWGWGSAYSMACYGSVLIFSAVFYLIEKNHKEPIIDFKFFKNKIFVGTLANNFIVFMGMMGGVFLIPVFVQTFLGYNATQTGYLFIPLAFFMMLSAQIGGRLVGRVKFHHVIFISTLIASVGLYLFVFFIDARASALSIIIPLSVMAFGMGLGMAQRTNAIASTVPEDEIGVASSILALVRNISGAFGIAIFATILQSTIKSKVAQVAQNTVIYQMNPVNYQKAVSLVILKAQISAYATVFEVSALIVFIGAIFALFVRIKNEDKVSKAKVHVEG